MSPWKAVGLGAIALAALLLASASETPESVGAQVCGGQVVAVVVGCNPIAMTHPDGTPIETIAGCVSPAVALISIWKFDNPAGGWLGYSPVVPPEVNNLAEVNRLDAVFVCVNAPGTFTRPLI